MNGWIKLHRKILDNPISKNPLWLVVWIHLLLMANHDGTYSFIFNGKRVFLQSGQVLTGRKKLAQQTGVSQTTIERVLSYLEIERQIGQQKTTKYRVITILKWKEYQMVDSKKTTNGQQTDTYKNIRSKEDTNTSVHSTEDDVEIIPEPSEKKQQKKADPSKFNPLGAEIIKAMADKVSPYCSRYYRVPAQREACDLLISTYGLEKVLRAVDLLPKTNEEPYFPTIMTPLQLYQKYEALRSAFARGKKEHSRKNPEVII
jgi:DNA-binding transcriptional regulator YhcF (GntR family)